MSQVFRNGDVTVVTIPQTISDLSSTALPQSPPLSDNSTQVATTAWVKGQGYSGGAGTGAVNSVFGRFGTVVSSAGDYVVAQITGAAPLASPALTGTPTAPTPTLSDSSTLIATTAFVKGQNFATLASPALTGTPTAPTVLSSDNSTSIATTAWVQSQITSGATSNRILSPNTAQTAPPGAVSAAPTGNGNNPFWWFQDQNNAWRALMGIETLVAGTQNATVVFYNKVGINDTGQTPLYGKNAAFTIFHTTGSGTDQNNQDRAMYFTTQTPSADTSSHKGIAGIQGELDLYGAPTMFGSPDSEISTASFELYLGNTNQLTYPNQYGVNALRLTTFRASSGSVVGGPYTASVLRCEMANSTTSPASWLVGAYFKSHNDSSATSGISGANIYVEGVQNAARYPDGIAGVYINDYGTDHRDRAIFVQSVAQDSSYTELQGPLILGQALRLTHTAASAPGNTDFVGQLTLSGGTATYTFKNTSNTSPPIAFVQDPTGAGVSFVVTNTTLTVTGTGTNKVNYLLVFQN